MFGRCSALQKRKKTPNDYVQEIADQVHKSAAIDKTRLLVTIDATNFDQPDSHIYICIYTHRVTEYRHEVVARRSFGSHFRQVLELKDYHQT
jgi:hypothetical protein